MEFESSLFPVVFILVGINYAEAIPKLLVISLDGFRYDYLSMYNAPNLNKFAKEGVSAPEGMIPVFPSVTFPNHQTLVTGLYPENHGIVYNTMYDPNFNESFQYGNETKWWNSTRPIWITSKENGIKTGVSFWPGCSVDFDGVKADFIDPYVHKTPFQPRVDKMIDWITKQDITLGIIYFEQPDGEGHRFGPISEQVGAMVKSMDELIGNMFERLKEHNLYDKMNIIILSDHGMSNVTKDKDHALLLEKYLSPDDYEVIPQLGVIGAIMPANGKTETVYNKLKDVNPNIKVYLKKDIPEKFHYQNNVRIMPIVIISDEHYFVALNESSINVTNIGMHGYDNELKVMRPIFMARGPSFKKKVQLAPFKNLDVYPLLCRLLNIKPHPCNGTIDVFESVLQNSAVNLMQSNFIIISITLSVKFFSQNL